MIRIVLIAVFVSAMFFVLSVGTQHMPPPKILIATGPAGGAYDYFGHQYHDELIRRGTQVDLVETLGSVDNIARLHDRKSRVVAALVQGGITGERDQADLESLGTVSYEPLWLFSRVDATVSELVGRTISIGADGSGTQVLARMVAESYAGKAMPQWRTVAISEGRPALLAGKIDALFLVEAFDAPNVQALLHDPGIRVVGYPAADALVNVSPVLHHVVLPKGSIDLLADPPADIDLVSPKTSVVVRKDLHPAIKYVLLEAMRHVHDRPAMFTKSLEFPAPEAIGLRLSETARQFYAHAEPFYYRLLPYWIADLVATSIALLVPVYAVLSKPLGRLLARRRARS